MNRTNEQEDQEIAAVWDAIGPAGHPCYKHLSLSQRRETLLCIIKMCGGVEKAVEHFRYLNERLVADDNVRIGYQCPNPGDICNEITLDSTLKVYFHPTYPPHIPGPKMWNFYIAHADAQYPVKECVDWKREGVKVTMRGPDGRWGECMCLVSPPGVRVRVEYWYPFMLGDEEKGKGRERERRTQEIVFPLFDNPFPVHYLRYDGWR